MDGQFAHAISIEGDLICVRADDGQLAWSKNFARDFGGRMMSQWGFSESPLVDGPLVICERQKDHDEKQKCGDPPAPILAGLNGGSDRAID